MIKKQFLFFLIVAFSVPIWAQKDAKMKADKAYDHLGYLKAADLYQQMGEGGLDTVAKTKLADSYRLNGDTESAEYWYAQSVAKTGKAEDMLHFAQVLQSNGKCEAALNWYEQYRTLMGSDNPLPRAELSDCSKMVFLPKQRVIVTNERELNSGHLEYSPIPYKGGLVFTSTRGKEGKGIEDQWTKDNFSDLFFAQKIGNQGFDIVKLMQGSINGNFHDGAATFNKSGSIMYFSRNNDKGKNSKDVVDLKIYSAELQNQQWINVQELPFNNKEFSTCHPTLAADGITLYFSSNRLGGIGGMDIYRSIRSGSTWSAPENLGTSVNTAGNEIFPFIDKDGTLFFASDGLPGIGGLDIYQTSFNNGKWIKAENVGEPINSAKDDFSYSVLENGEAGYFSSNRSGGQGGDDIYHWTSNLSGTNPQNIIAVIDEVTEERLPDAVVTIVEGIYNKNKSISSGTKVSNNGVNPSEYYAQPVQFLTDTKGKVQPEVKSGKTYTIFVEKSGYTAIKKVVNASELMRTPEWIVPLKKRKGLPLSGTVIHEEYDHFIPNATVELFNFCTGEYERTLSDEKGNFEFFLECNCDYELVGKKDRFREDKKNYSTLGRDCQSTKPIKSLLYLKVSDAPIKSKPGPTPPPPTVNVKPTPAPPVIIESEPLITTSTYKVGQIITLDNVYYDFNKATIRGDASYELDRVVEILHQYPSMEIQLLSHTDARGNKVYNEDLSQRRAELAVKYLITRGITANRLTSKGYGKWLLKNHCADGINCSESEHQANRRTEIKITKLDADVEVRYRK